MGHVDGVGYLESKRAEGDGASLTVSFPRDLERYLVFKGSIAVDGISLTIASLEKTRFTVAVVPHTLKATNLGFLQDGAPVNLEVDVLGKYVERLMQLGIAHQPDSNWTLEYLKGQGF
jgi:riboflavin synthase